MLFSKSLQESGAGYASLSSKIYHAYIHVILIYFSRINSSWCSKGAKILHEARHSQVLLSPLSSTSSARDDDDDSGVQKRPNFESLGPKNTRRRKRNSAPGCLFFEPAVISCLALLLDSSAFFPCLVFFFAVEGSLGLGYVCGGGGCVVFFEICFIRLMLVCSIVDYGLKIDLIFFLFWGVGGLSRKNLH